MDTFNEQIQNWVNNNQLLYIEVVLKKVGRKEVLGRIVQFNGESLLIYKEDTKMVEHYLLNEIDNIVPVNKQG
ncbi:hypothetical protein IMZ08_16705 [Bacillus luteolus]|uniref:DUF2642 domain-containing protein n=1 Tax=Litchfieldia luteola TaxID=682179 RepID=A0ABR9QME9_9BACI|nr:hypothetical protein [Cytobacillus luteolus]MBE4909685.1 hypothetical protein [Cytobacillus luteolus]MBP1944561.1 hypothetical protein [Cytobacillus luteolus]